MVWRVIGVFASLTFILSAFSIWGDPNCKSITSQGGRFIQFTCHPDSTGSDSFPIASAFLIFGLGLLAFNVWPFIRGYLDRRETKAPVEPELVPSKQHAKASPERTEASQSSQGLPTGKFCSSCSQKISSKQKFCSNCGNRLEELDSKASIYSESKPQAIHSFKDERAYLKPLVMIFAVVAALVILFGIANAGSNSLKANSPGESTKEEVIDVVKNEQISIRAKFRSQGYWFGPQAEIGYKWLESVPCKEYSTCVWAELVSVKECYGISYTAEAQTKSGLVVSGKTVNRIFGLSPAVPARFEVEAFSDNLDYDYVVISDPITCSG